MSRVVRPSGSNPPRAVTDMRRRKSQWHSEAIANDCIISRPPTLFIGRSLTTHAKVHALTSKYHIDDLKEAATQLSRHILRGTEASTTWPHRFPCPPLHSGKRGRSPWCAQGSHSCQSVRQSDNLEFGQSMEYVNDLTLDESIRTDPSIQHTQRNGKSGRTALSIISLNGMCFISQLSSDVLVRCNSAFSAGHSPFAELDGSEYSSRLPFPTRFHACPLHPFALSKWYGVIGPTVDLMTAWRCFRSLLPAVSRSLTHPNCLRLLQVCQVPIMFGKMCTTADPNICLADDLIVHCTCVFAPPSVHGWCLRPHFSSSILFALEMIELMYIRLCKTNHHDPSHVLTVTFDDGGVHCILDPMASVPLENRLGCFGVGAFAGRTVRLGTTTASSMQDFGAH